MALPSTQERHSSWTRIEEPSVATSDRWQRRCAFVKPECGAMSVSPSIEEKYVMPQLASPGTERSAATVRGKCSRTFTCALPTLVR